MRYEIEDAAESRDAGIAYHLAPVDVWEREKASGSYTPEAFGQDGFLHATNGLGRLRRVANEFYTADARPYTVLVLDVAKLEAPMRYDDEGQLFPHIYGPLNVDAVIAELPVHRGDEGVFLGFGSSGNDEGAGGMTP